MLKEYNDVVSNHEWELEDIKERLLDKEFARLNEISQSWKSIHDIVYYDMDTPLLKPIRQIFLDEVNRDPNLAFNRAMWEVTKKYWYYVLFWKEFKWNYFQKINNVAKIPEKNSWALALYWEEDFFKNNSINEINSTGLITLWWASNTSGEIMINNNFVRMNRSTTEERDKLWNILANNELSHKIFLQRYWELIKREVAWEDIGLQNVTPYEWLNISNLTEVNEFLSDVSSIRTDLSWMYRIIGNMAGNLKVEWDNIYIESRETDNYQYSENVMLKVVIDTIEPLIKESGTDIKTLFDNPNFTLNLSNLIKNNLSEDKKLEMQNKIVSHWEYLVVALDNLKKEQTPA